MNRITRIQWGGFVAVVIVAVSAGAMTWMSKGAGSAPTQSQEAAGAAAVRPGAPSVPISFAPNRGQAGEPVCYLSAGGSFSVALTPSEAILAYRTSGTRTLEFAGAVPGGADRKQASSVTHRMRWLGADPHPVLRALDPLPGTANFYTAAGPQGAVTGLPTFARVRYEGLWPGIDVDYHGEAGALEYDFIVSPGADPHAIRLAFPGADRLALDGAGNLEVSESGTIVPHAQPRLYQEREGRRVPVTGRYVLRDQGEVGFEVEAYDRSRALVIDPVISYSRYLGEQLETTAMHVDENGIWVLGKCAMSTVPVTDDPINAGAIGADASEGIYLTRLDATGTTVLFSTCLLGDGDGTAFVNDETPFGLDVDASGNAYVAGSTNTYSIPYITTGPTTSSGPLDIFTARFASDGTLGSMRYVGGSGTDGSIAGSWIAGAGDLRLDGSGNVWIISSSDSPNLDTLYPGLPGYDKTFAGGVDVVLFRLDPVTLDVTYWSFLGEAGNDRGLGIRFDSDGDIYLTGATSSSAFPVTTGAFQTTMHGLNDFFVAKMAADGSGLIYATYLGGSDLEGYVYPSGPALAVDASGCVTVRGITLSSDFPVLNAAQASFGGGTYDGFVTKLDAAGANLVFSTYLGGGGDDYPCGVIADAAGNTYLSGATTSADFPQVNGTASLQGLSDGFLAKFAPSGALVASVIIGGSGTDDAGTLALDPSGELILAGVTGSADFPGAVNTLVGNSDGWLVRLRTSGAISGQVTADCPTAGTPLAGITVDAFVSGTTVLASTTVTAADGSYTIPDLAAGAYTVSVVTPLGYAASGSDASVEVSDGGTATADFAFTCVAATGTARGGGFWKHQVGVALGGAGHALVGPEVLCGHLDVIGAHFNDNAMNQVVVYEPPAGATCVQKLETAAALLNLPGRSAMIDRARSQLFALLLNVASGSLGLQTVASEDGATVSQAITFCDNLVDDPSGDYALAKNIAEMINAGIVVPAGLIPLTTANIAYRGPTLLQFAAGPSPASGNRTFRFATARGGKVALRVFDVHGRLVSRVFEGSLDAGQHSLGWNGRSADGQPLSAGIYFARLSVGKETLQTKLVQTTR